ncbi:glutamic acid-rich protein [Etheostoma spectabile]|uniref:glutamic acid-rich protein n=1 Tax=Etheostoma spectabile TaxID=54343 RepID=UPI0013AF505D|nr:glutamic acid-rich protein-like [Etheostoma spectabile]
MSKVQMLRGLVEQRLTAAAEEIFGLFERTIAEYEEELCRSKEEHERQRKRLDAVFSPQLRLHRAELPQQHVCKEVEVNMPVITSVESEANRDPQLHGAESQDQKGGQHGDSGSARNAEPEPKKRRRKSRSPSNNVDNTNMSEVHPDTQTELPQQHVCKEVEVNMPVITSVESEANRDPQLHGAESQDQKGGQHGDSGSARNAEPEPKKRRRKSRSPSNNVDNTNMSEVHPDTQTELPQQHVCKEEEVLSDQQLCIQVRNSSLDREDPEPPQIEEELCTSQEAKEDDFRHSNNVNNTNVPEIHRNTQTDVQQLSVVKAEVPPEQQEWSSSLDQEHPDPPHIKEEQEELWTSQEREQLQGLEEADIKFPFTSVPVKSEEDDEEKAQSSQLHESQTEDNRGAERTGADGEDWGGPEPATYYKTLDSSESETDYSGDWEESGLNPLPNNEEPVSDVGCNTGNTSVSSSECAGSFDHEEYLQKHHSGDQTENWDLNRECYDPAEISEATQMFAKLFEIKAEDVSGTLYLEVCVRTSDAVVNVSNISRKHDVT